MSSSNSRRLNSKSGQNLIYMVNGTCWPGLLHLVKKSGVQTYPSVRGCSSQRAFPFFIYFYHIMSLFLELVELLDLAVSRTLLIDVVSRFCISYIIFDVSDLFYRLIKKERHVLNHDSNSRKAQLWDGNQLIAILHLPKFLGSPIK